MFSHHDSGRVEKGGGNEKRKREMCGNRYTGLDTVTREDEQMCIVSAVALWSVTVLFQWLFYSQRWFVHHACSTPMSTLLTGWNQKTGGKITTPQGEAQGLVPEGTGCCFSHQRDMCDANKDHQQQRFNTRSQSQFNFSNAVVGLTIRAHWCG